MFDDISPSQAAPYIHTADTPYPKSPIRADLQTPQNRIIYVTDRLPELSKDGETEFGSDRPRQVRFGTADVNCYINHRGVLISTLQLRLPFIQSALIGFSIGSLVYMALVLKAFVTLDHDAVSKKSRFLIAVT